MTEISTADSQRIQGVSLNRPSTDGSCDGDCLMTQDLRLAVACDEHEPPTFFGEYAGELDRRRVLGQERSGFPIRIERSL